jgi:hypothetical protein
MSKQSAEDDRNRFELEIDIAKRLNSLPTDGAASHGYGSHLSDGELTELQQNEKMGLDLLEKRYLDTKNPIHVWEAISSAYQYALYWNELLVFPAWVQAYLVTSAPYIVTDAVWAKDADERKTLPDLPGQFPGLGRNRLESTIEDFLPKVRPHQRLDTVLKALKFKRGSGSNPIMQARRRRKLRHRVDAIEHAREQQKLSLEQAVELLGAQEYQGEDGKTRYYRDRRFVNGET